MKHKYVPTSTTTNSQTPNAKYSTATKTPETSKASPHPTAKSSYNAKTIKQCNYQPGSTTPKNKHNTPTHKEYSSTNAKATAKTNSANNTQQ